MTVKVELSRDEAEALLDAAFNQREWDPHMESAVHALVLACGITNEDGLADWMAKIRATNVGGEEVETPHPAG